MHLYPIRLALVSVGLGFAVVALAENVYKCTDKDGGVAYQKERCENTRQAEEKRIDPDKNVIPWVSPPPSSSSAGPTPSSSTPSSSAPAPDSTVRKRRGGY